MKRPYRYAAEKMLGSPSSLARRGFALLLTLVGVTWGSAMCPAIAVGQVVLLTNGSVFQGEVSRQGDQYVVRQAGAQLRVDRSEVALTAETLADAYRKQAARIAPRNVDAHAKLASWCLRNQLVAEARHEIELTKQLDRRHPMLTLLERQLLTANRPRSVQLPTAPDPTAENLQAARLLQQLPRETVTDFVSTIQPLLLNRCGTSGCHGPTSGHHFRLTNAPWRPLSRHLTERNLAAVMQQIDAAAPPQSLLIMSAETAHGSLKKTPLEEAHLANLRQWVYRAVGFSPVPVPEGDPADGPIDPPVELDRLTNDGRDAEGAARDGVAAGDGHGGRAAAVRREGRHSAVAGEQPLSDRERQQRSLDPFDPEVFNRRQQLKTSRLPP